MKVLAQTKMQFASTIHLRVYGVPSFRAKPVYQLDPFAKLEIERQPKPAQSKMYSQEVYGESMLKKMQKWATKKIYTYNTAPDIDDIVETANNFRQEYNAYYTDVDTTIYGGGDNYRRRRIEEQLQRQAEQMRERIRQQRNYFADHAQQRAREAMRQDEDRFVMDEIDVAQYQRRAEARRHMEIYANE